MAQKILFVFLVLLVVFEKGSSLTCYNCTTLNHNDACADPTKEKDAVTHKECAQGESCTVYTIENPTTGRTSVWRKCGSKDLCNIMKQHESDYEKLVDCHVCDSDLCNTGKTFSISVMILLFLLILGSFIS